MKKIVALALALVLCFTCMQISVQAAWQQSGGKWYYTDANGKNVTGWKQVGGVWYYFNAQGVMQTGWLLYGKDWYYLNASGAMVTGTVTIGGVQHKFDANGVWQGEVQNGKTGWVQESGKWYYYQNGTKATGWVPVSGVWYYFNAQGVMQTGWLLYGKDWYYLNASGAMVTGTVTIGGVQHKFDANGVWQGEVQTAKNGWLLEGGKWFYYKNGAKATGWLLYGKDWYYLKASGEMSTGWLLYGKAWYYLTADGIMATGWQELGADKYYFGTDGIMATDTVVDGVIIGPDGKAKPSSAEPQDPPVPPSTSTITIGLPMNARVEDYYTNALTLWLEAETGYDIEFVFYASSETDAKTQIITQIVAGTQLPDIILGVNLGENGDRYGEDGFFADLTPYFLDNNGVAKNFWDRMNECLTQEERDQVMRTIYNAESGTIYSVPTVTTSDMYTSDCLAWINREWLDILGLEMPTNMEEFYNVLVAFKNNDPNGNGKKDEIPMMGAERMTGGQFTQWLINMFLYYDTDSLWQPDANGQLQPVFTQESYREALKFVNKLVKEGLISNVSFNAGAADFRTIANSGFVGILACDMSYLAQVGGSAEILFKYDPIFNWGYTVERDITCKQNTFISANADVAAAFKVLMTLYSYEGTLRMRYGEKDVDWQEGWGSSYTGAEGRVELLNNVTSGASNSWWGFQASGILDADGTAAVVADCQTDEEYWLVDNLETGAKYIAWGVYSKTPEKVCPTLQSEELYTASNLVITEADNYRTKFASGQLDPNNDTDWAAYLQALEEAGLAQATAVYQEQYNTLAECAHKFTEATCNEASVCILCGKTQGAPAGHDFDASACKRCGKEILGLTEASWEATVITENSVTTPRLRFDEGECMIFVGYYYRITEEDFFGESVTADFDWYWFDGNIYGQVPSGTMLNGTYTVNGDTVTMDFYGIHIVMTKTAPDRYTVTSADEYLNVGTVLISEHLDEAYE